jgi:multidrug efflux system membrane fusion protein
VVTTGFASLSDGAKVSVGKDEPAPVADIAPRKRNRGGSEGGRVREGREARDGQPAKEWQGERERRGKRGERVQNEGDQQGQTGLVQGSGQGSDQPGNAAKSQP